MYSFRFVYVHVQVHVPFDVFVYVRVLVMYSCMCNHVYLYMYTYIVYDNVFVMRTHTHMRRLTSLCVFATRAGRWTLNSSNDRVADWLTAFDIQGLNAPCGGT